MPLYKIENNIQMPTWLGQKNFHASHRSNLKRKDELYYEKYEWNESSDLPYLWPVSYTHLRAHETPEHLVCRLLLEKKKKKKEKKDGFSIRLRMNRTTNPPIYSNMIHNSI